MIAWSSQSDETVLSESRLLNLTVRPRESRKLVASWKVCIVVSWNWVRLILRFVICLKFLVASQC